MRKKDLVIQSFLHPQTTINESMRVTGSSLLSDKVAERSAIASSSTYVQKEQIPCGWATSQNGIIETQG